MKQEFKAASKRLLEMMIHSIYTKREIFLREIISNASDAIDKCQYLALTDDSVKTLSSEFAITLTLDKAARTLTVSDNGIGMDEKDLEENLGVIAASGSLEFKESMKESEQKSPVEIIGQFGVGFYSAFMVADEITVITKKHGCDKAYRWHSDGADGYEITEAVRDEHGTDVIMHMREDAEGEDTYGQFLREYPLYKLVRKYSDYIRYPIRMLMPHPVPTKESTPENPQFEEVFEYEVFNSMVPIWQRARSEVTKEQQEAFYCEHFGDKTPPRSILTADVEGNVTYKALLYIPSGEPKDYGTDEYKAGLELYSAGVLIMDNCTDLLPEEFNFVRGVVDSPDLSLNISREMLQHDNRMGLMRSALAKKIGNELRRMLKKDRECYEEFYRHFGTHLKVCAMDDYAAKKDALADLLLFSSAKKNGLVTLDEYIESMAKDQKFIYYAYGDSISAVLRLPQLEAVKDHGMDTLLFTHQADNFVAKLFGSYKEKPFKSVMDRKLGFDDEKRYEDARAYADLVSFVKKTLGASVDAVTVSSRLKSHPVCLSSGDGMTFEMERYFKSLNPNAPAKAKRILELNVTHPAVEKLNAARTEDPALAEKYCQVLLQQGRLMAGLPIEDPTAYTDLLVSLW